MKSGGGLVSPVFVYQKVRPDSLDIIACEASRPWVLTEFAILVVRPPWVKYLRTGWAEVRRRYLVHLRNPGGTERNRLPHFQDRYRLGATMSGRLLHC